MRVLIVEDEIRIRKGMAKLIENHTEHTVIGEAQNGKEGMEMALLYEPDLIITDIRMPVMDGLEMMRQLQETEEKWHFVILSGYSEFEYAKKAIRYGADDYLIKPLAPEDVMKLLDSMEEKLKKERTKNQEKPEVLLRNYLVEKEEGALEKLERTCVFRKKGPFRMISAYVGNLSKEDRDSCVHRMERFQKEFPQEIIYYFFTESTREFLAFVLEAKWSTLKNELEEKLLKRRESEKQWIWTSCRLENLNELGESYQTLRKMYKYALVLKTDSIIEQDKIDNFIPEEYTYPKKNKKRIQDAFYQKNKQKFQSEIELFLEEMSRKKVKPSQAREEYMQMAYFLINLAKENDSRIYEQLQNLSVTQNIGMAFTQKELKLLFLNILQIFLENMNEKHNISNFVILRAIDYIREHYQESVSLEEIAGTLDITPEYLSTLFNREMGENFSSFLKKFRISHAKRLLKETDKKIYEIASEVGYADPKYFNRVFKEVEGISPGDYRGLKG